MLRHETTITVNIPVDYCKQCILNPSEFLAKSRHTYTIRKLGEGKYEVVFRWVKFKVERFFKVILEVRIRGDTIEYASTPESPYEFSIRIKLEDTGNGTTRIHVEARMKPGLLANLLGKKSYSEFIEELIEKGIVGMAKTLVAKQKPKGVETGVKTSKASCQNCLLYDPSRKYCYALGREVDGSGPECRGRFYLPRQSPPTKTA